MGSRTQRFCFPQLRLYRLEELLDEPKHGSETPPTSAPSRVTGIGCPSSICARQIFHPSPKAGARRVIPGTVRAWGSPQPHHSYPLSLE